MRAPHIHRREPDPGARSAPHVQPGARISATAATFLPDYINDTWQKRGRDRKMTPSTAQGQPTPRQVSFWGLCSSSPHVFQTQIGNISSVQLLILLVKINSTL